MNFIKDVKYEKETNMDMRRRLPFDEVAEFKRHGEGGRPRRVVHDRLEEVVEEMVK